MKKLRYVRFQNGTGCYTAPLRQPAGKGQAIAAGLVLALLVVLQFTLPV
ncbi:hypothetical protein [Chromobacterium rhizoryzae]|nr:hypothetical protein [Chromobacterium rhizoryzae]